MTRLDSDEDCCSYFCCKHAFVVFVFLERVFTTGIVRTIVLRGANTVECRTRILLPVVHPAEVVGSSTWFHSTSILPKSIFAICNSISASLSGIKPRCKLPHHSKGVR